MRSSARGLLVALGVLSGSCAEDFTLLDVPEEVRWVGLLERGAGGEVLAASPLYAYAPGAPVALYSSGEQPLVVGFDDGISEQVAAAGEVALQEPLRAATMCEARLPPARWWSALDGAREVAAPPPLTAGWLAGRCEPLGPEDLSVEVDCTPIVCASGTSWSTPCRARVLLTECELDPLEVARSPFGETCAVVPEGWDCVPRLDPPPYASVSLTCDVSLGSERRSCGVNVYERAPGAPFPLDGVGIERVRVVDVSAPEAPEGLARGRLLEPEHAGFGVAWGLSVVEGEVWVSHLRDQTGNVDCHAPQGRPPASLTRLDADRLDPIATIDAPPCLQALAARPGGGAFGVFARADAPGWWLGRFGPEGALVDAAPVPSSAPTAGQWVAGVLTFPERGSVVVLTSSFGPDHLRISEFDGGDLGLVSTSTRGPGAVHRVSKIDARSFVGGVNGVQWFMARYDLDEPNVRAEEIVRPMFRGNLVINDVLHHPMSGRVAISIARDEASVRAWDPPGFTRADFYERPTQPGALGPWPLDPGLVLSSGVTGEADGVWRGVIQLFDPVRGQLLPGSRLVGDSGISQIVEGPRGRLFMLLPWTGEVVRLTP